VRDVHRALFDRSQDTVTLTVADVGAVAAAALERLRPKLAERLRADDTVELASRDIGTLSATVAHETARIRWLSVLLTLLVVAVAAAAVALAPDRRRAVVDLAVGAVVAGVVTVVALWVLRSIAIGHVEGAEEQAAAGAVWDAFLGDLRTAGWIVAGLGAVVAAAASSLIRPADAGEPLRVAWRAVTTEPAHPALRVLRAAAFVVAGIFVVVDGAAALTLVTTVAGAYLVFAGMAIMLRLVYVPEHERPAPAPAEPRSGRRRRLAVPVIAVGVVALVVGGFVASGAPTAAAPAGGPCNGSAALCHRPLDRVALPATHNAMSVPLPGWYSAEQDRPIPDQLRDGVRGLLIDTHYGDLLGNGRVRTVFDSASDLSRQVSADGRDQEAVDAALRIRARLGFRGEGERGLYLCHTFCELGATPLDVVLDQLHEFLVANPGEVVVVINQDEGVPAADFVQAVEDAGLGDLVATPPADGRWPTLRQMVDRGRRVVFVAERNAGAAPWYRRAYSLMQETPYTFPRVRELTDPAQLPASCATNRGPRSAPLFLLNHWISTDPAPRPSQAAEVNAYGPLLRRARECERIRGRLPNLVAVNFYKRGALFRVVDTLNGE
jgi:hypothetical protein